MRLYVTKIRIPTRLTVKERKTIRKFSASVIGFEIIEEEATQAI